MFNKLTMTVQIRITPSPSITIFGGGTPIGNITLPMIEDTSVLDLKDWVDPRY